MRPDSLHGEAVADGYQRLRDAITSGELMPNEHLVEADLVSRFGVGRTAVRTALARLQQEGLVVHEPHRGARVRMISESEAIELTETREVLEGLAAKRAAERATLSQVADLWDLVDQMTALVSCGDLLRYSGVNAILHAYILDISGHETVQKLLAALQAQMVRFQYRTILVPGRARVSLEEHRTLVQAIADHDGAAAERAMRHHLENVRAALTDATVMRPTSGG